MDKYNDLEENLIKKFQNQEKRKRRKMRVVGKKVFELKKIIEKKANKKTS